MKSGIPTAIRSVFPLKELVIANPPIALWVSPSNKRKPIVNRVLIAAVNVLLEK